MKLDGPGRWTRHEYAELIDFCVLVGSRVQFVYQDDLDFEPSARALVDVLNPDGEQATRRSKRWPGTRLLDGKATVCSVPLTEQVAVWLKEGPLPYDWIAPKWPEDVAILRRDGSVVFGSIAHERDSWLKVRRSEVALLDRFPALMCCLRAR
ncbi:MAG: hypothetical protein QM708_06650 [Propioniciclava sp.]|uniref:hypothetical protein n=1 Tax=Propioniciclava sp. TaxID=2038686 RepID=UPI0039E65F97